MTDVRSRWRSRALIAAAAVAAAEAFADVPVTAVPPADYRPRAVTKSASTKMALPPGTPGWRISLPEPSVAERASLAARNATKALRRDKSSKEPKRSLALGFPRSVPQGLDVIGLDALPWQTLADGSRTARVEIASPGAAAVRVALALTGVDPRATLRFSGNGARAQVFGPVTSAKLVSDSALYGAFWSPVLEGDVASIELQLAAGVPLPQALLTIPKISHQVVGPAMLRKLDPKAVSDIGTSAACNVDVACVTPASTAFTDSTRAVAAIEMTKDDGFTYLCTGTLLNDAASSNTPYLFSAAHCIDSGTAARTLNAFWFFDAVACGSTTVPPYVQQAAGATMLARSPDWDWALVRLNADPPSGSRFSAWRAEPIPANAAVSVLHHPEGDLKKWSQGSAQGYQLYTDGSSFAEVQYDRGTTEPGSSGAGLLTFLASGGYYEVRGGLWRGDASCDFRSGVDEYSRLDNMLPLTREYLTPNAPGIAGQRVAVEFYHRGLDHYFMTIDPSEIDDLDTGFHPGWERTGLRFIAYQTSVAGTSPVCRFYRAPGFGNSHFYSASPAECAIVIANPQTYPGWVHESASVFHLALPHPVSGACAAGTQPVWRFYNERTINHRYTIDHTLRDEMRADPATWSSEGYGPDSVSMCAPVGS